MKELKAAGVAIVLLLLAWCFGTTFDGVDFGAIALLNLLLFFVTGLGGIAALALVVAGLLK